MVVEKLPARHRDDGRGDAFGLQQIARRQGHADLATCGQQGRLALAIALGQDVSAARRKITGAGAYRGKALAAEGQDRGTGVVFQGQGPALRRLHRVGRAKDAQVGDSAQAGQGFHRLVGRAVLTEANGIMGQHVDHPYPHERRQPHGWAHVVGEDQEGAAIGNKAAVQGHAGHGGGHGVLAHPVVDVTPDEVSAVYRGKRPHLGVVGTGEIGRSANHFWNGLGQDLEGLSRGLARRPLGFLGEDAPDVHIQRRLPTRWQEAGRGALELGFSLRLR